MNIDSRRPDAAPQVHVWDRFVRAAHWLLAGGFAVAYLTEGDWLTIHVWAGYLAGSIVLLRILWGFIGTGHARFGDFLYSPRAALDYLLDMLRGRARRHLGHSPAGAMMVFALLIGVLATGGSGLMVYAYDKHAGPLAGIVDSHYATVPPDQRSRAFASAEDFWEEAHEALANLTLLLVALHIAGVTLASFRHRENLVGAMVTGRKTAEPPE